MTEEEEDEESIFKVPHSLPSSAHGAAVSTRTPSGPPKVDSNKYMPAYGGMFELPGTRIQHNGLIHGIPFFPNPLMVWVRNRNHDKPIIKQPLGAQCLLVSSYLRAASNNHLTDKSFSLMRTSGSTLYLDIASSIICDRSPPEYIESWNYAQVPYSYPIRGIKYCDKTSNYVIVSFRQGIKLIQLNNQYKVPPTLGVEDECETENEPRNTDRDIELSIISDQPAINFVGSYPAKKGVEVIDACMSTNQNLLNIACCDEKDLRIKIYDISRPRICLSVISKCLDDEASIKLSMNGDSSLTRKRTFRSFVPTGNVLEEVHQIECNQSHLINSVITTSTKVSQIDPRIDVIAEHYVDKFKLENALPTEKFKRLEFSRKNDYQFYLTTNEKIRVFDRRFRSKDINILDHLLDSASYYMMASRLIPNDSSDIETLCISSYGRLCLASFDQSHYTHTLIESAGHLVNPKSTHQPIHEPSPIELTGRASDQLYGLAVSSSDIFDSDDVLFSTLQLSPTGKVCIRGFPKARARNIPDRKLPSLRSENFRILEPAYNQDNPDIDPTRYRVLGANEDSDEEDEYMDLILQDNMSEFEARPKSKRAIEKHESIRKMCGR